MCSYDDNAGSGTYIDAGVEVYPPPPYGPPAAWTGGSDLQQQQYPPQGQGHE